MSFDLKIYNKDLVIGSNGDLQKVEDNEKLVQDILKLLVTELGANPFHPYYGSLLSNTIIGNAFDFEFSTSMAKEQISKSLETLQNLQRAQTQGSQKVTPGELLAAIQDVRVSRHPVDPRFFSIFVKVLTKALTSVDTSFNVGL